MDRSVSVSTKNPSCHRADQNIITANMDPAAPTAGPVRRRATRPLLWWIISSSLLFLWQFHHTKARNAKMLFTVSLERSKEQIDHDATLNGLPYKAGQPCGLGWKKLIVHARDAEPFETNCFVWYGGETFGNIILARTRGSMDLDFSPAVETVQIIGSEERKSLTNVTHQSLSLPTGLYRVEARFARFSIERTVEVSRNKTIHVAMAPSITTFNLSSEPDMAEFELNSKKPPEVSVRGSTPASVTGLLVGEYDLAIARADYRKILSVTLTGSKATNEMKVEFRYAKVSITSEPTEAAISDGDKVIGKTPASFDLQPGSYRFQITKAGYFGTNLNLSLSETDSLNVSVSLANVSFVEAMERARRQSSGISSDYDLALSDVEKALQIKLGDESALQLKRTIEFNRHLRNARQFQRNGDFDKALSEAGAALKLSPNNADALALKGDLETARRAADEQRAKEEQAAAAARAEARLNHPQKVFEGIMNRTQYNELFKTEWVRLKGSLDTVHSGVVRSLGRKPEWSVRRDAKTDTDTMIMQADHKGLGSKHTVVLVVGQITDGEVMIYFKLFSYALGNQIQITLSGISDESYKPVHPRFYPDVLAATIEQKQARHVEEFKKRITEEFR